MSAKIRCLPIPTHTNFTFVSISFWWTLNPLPPQGLMTSQQEPGQTYRPNECTQSTDCILYFTRRVWGCLKNAMSMKWGWCKLYNICLGKPSTGKKLILGLVPTGQTPPSQFVTHLNRKYQSPNFLQKSVKSQNDLFFLWMAFLRVVHVREF